MSNTSLSPKGIAALLGQVKPTMEALKKEGIGSPVSLEGLDDRAAALRAYLGPTDYSKQLQQAQDAAKLQAALSLASRGFASMGATPKRGESPFATIGRELLAPVGADLIPVSTDLMKRKAAIDAAKQAEDRQVKLAALTQAQAEKKSQESLALSLIETMTKTLGTTNLSSTIKDNQQFSATVGDKVLTAVGPVLVVKSKDGKQQQIRTLGSSTTLSGEVIPAGTLVESVSKAPEKATIRPKPAFGQLYKDGKFVDVKNVTVTSKVGADNITPINNYFIRTGTPGNVKMKNITADFSENIGVHGKWTSGDDLYVADSEKVGNVGIQGVRDGDKIQMFVRSALPDMGGTDEVQYRFKGKDVTGKISPLLNTLAVQTRPLDESQKQAAGQTAPTYKTQQKLVFDEKTVKLVPGAEIGEEVTVEANTNDPSDVRYMFRGTPLDASVGKKIAARPLSEVQKATEGLTFRTNEAVTNIGRTDVKIAGVTVKPGETRTFTNVDLNKLKPDVRASLRPYNESADTSTIEFMFTELQTFNGKNYSPGDRISLTPTKYRLATEKAPSLVGNLTKDPSIKSDTLKKNYFKAVWKTVQKLQKSVIPVSNRNRPPTESELKSLLGQFPTGRRGQDALSTAILRILQDPGIVAPASTNAATVVEDNQSFADQVQAQLNSALDRYTPLVQRGVLPNRPWDQLSYIEKRAFANLPSRGMSETTVNQNWEAAQKKIRDQMAKFNLPEPSDSAAVAASAKLKILVDYLLASADMDNTGKLIGPFAELGATTFADYDIFTSSSSQRVNQIITNMRAHLRTLSTEGSDTRPSNYRIQLQEELVPMFTRAEELNKRNLETISRKLDSSLKSLFTPESTRKNVVPQSWVKAAQEAGVSGAKVDPKLYASFMDPNDPINTNFELVTRADVMSDLGKFPFSLPDFQSLRVGQPLPPDGLGRIFIKISPTEVQLAKKGTRKYVPDSNQPKHVFGATP